MRPASSAGTCGVSWTLSVASFPFTRRPMIAMSTVAPFAAGLSKVPFTTGFVALSKLASPGGAAEPPEDESRPDEAPDPVPGIEQPATSRAAVSTATRRYVRRMVDSPRSSHMQTAGSVAT
jgi:hypothetical protein